MENLKIIFIIPDTTGRKIRLTGKQWNHIRMEHPDVTEEEIADTITKPEIRMEKEEKISYNYRNFKYRKQGKKFIKAIVKYLNGNGFVITAYPTKYPR